MKRRKKTNSKIHKTYFLTTTVTKFTKIFYIKDLAELFLENLGFYQKLYKSEMHGFVIMPNHLHLLMTIQEYELSGYGEIFLNPELDEIIRYAHEHKNVNKIVKPGQSSAHRWLQRILFLPRLIQEPFFDIHLNRDHSFPK